MKIEASFDFKDDEASCMDSLDGKLKVVSKGTVDTQVPGTYRVTYSATDTSGNPSFGKNCKEVETPKCRYFKGTVHAMCDGKSIKRWGVGPEGQVQAIKNCNYQHRDAKCHRAAVVRTIIVEDTLKPVIVLTHNDGTIMHTSNSDDTGLQGVKNGAGIAANEVGGSNPYLVNTNNSLMAEQSTNVNGWIIGAVASAVTGLALMGFSSRQSRVAVAVPV